MGRLALNITVVIQLPFTTVVKKNEDVIACHQKRICSSYDVRVFRSIHRNTRRIMLMVGPGTQTQYQALLPHLDKGDIDRRKHFLQKTIRRNERTSKLRYQHRYWVSGGEKRCMRVLHHGGERSLRVVADVLEKKSL